MSDDILDNMSLSDDEMLDNLADDMLMELEEAESSQTVMASTSAVPESWARGAVSNEKASPRVMPDLSQMMSQMMPMMSQMFGGTNPMYGNGTNSLQQASVSWQELVKRYVPSNEQEQWLTTIDKDATKLRVASMTTMLTKPHSRSYRATSSVMPSVYMKIGTMLANMLNDAVRSTHLEHNRQWQDSRDTLVSRLTQTGMSKVFENKFKIMLRELVINDPNYKNGSERYCNITTILSEQ